MEARVTFLEYSGVCTHHGGNRHTQVRGIREFCAELLYRTKCIGDPVLLPLEEMERVAGKFQTYGQTALR